MLFQNTSLTGPLPTGWALPPLQSIQLMSNQVGAAARLEALKGRKPVRPEQSAAPRPRAPPRPPCRASRRACPACLPAADRLHPQRIHRAGQPHLPEWVAAAASIARSSSRRPRQPQPQPPHARPLRPPPVHADLENNRMSGPLPASMAFNTSWDVYGLSVQNNNFSGAPPTPRAGCCSRSTCSSRAALCGPARRVCVGLCTPHWRAGGRTPTLPGAQGCSTCAQHAPAGPVPSWPDAPKSSMAIYPGNEGLCGTVRRHTGRSAGPRPPRPPREPRPRHNTPGTPC